jgi:hypothetical protein
MSPTARLNLALFLAIVLLAGFCGAMFTFSFWAPSVKQAWNEYWNENLPRPALKAGDRTISECLKVSDFYSARLTTYFLADSSESAGGPTDDLRKYDEYCDRVPGTGRVIFSLTLMEKEVRNDPVALSFFRIEGDGARKLISSLPSNRHPSGFVTLDASVSYRGKYVLQLAFGDAKNQEDVIEMPISVGR